MDNAITIYTNPWEDISDIKRVLNEHLLKYRVKDAFEYGITKDLPVVEIMGTRYPKPSKAQLGKILGLPDKENNYHDLVIIGSNLESFFCLDYAIKHEYDVCGIGNISGKNLTVLKKVYGQVLRVPNPFIRDFTIEGIPTSLEVLHNKTYIKIQVDDKVFFTRGACIILDEKISYHGTITNIYKSKEDILKEVTKKRIMNKRKRTFVIIGNGPSVLYDTYDLHTQLLAISPLMNFEIIVISSLLFPTQDQGLVKILRSNPNIKIFGQTYVKGFQKKDYRTIVKTDLIPYTADYIWEQDKKLENEYVKKLFDLDPEGYIETDHSGKTKFPNIYSIRRRPLIQVRDKRTALLDRYMACSKVIEDLYAYINLT